MSRAARAALAAAGGLILLLVGAQLLLPRIAEHRQRDRLERSGTVEQVDISAFPAVKLLWHKADDVTVRMGRLRTGSGNFADLRAALPPGFAVRPVASGNGALVFEGTAELLGQRFTGQATVSARDGRLRLEPNIPFGGVLSLTVFADPRVEVLGVGARRRPNGFTLTARVRLR